MLVTDVHQEAPGLYSVLTDPLFILDVIAPAVTAGEVAAFFHYLEERGLGELALSLVVRWASKDEEISIKIDQESNTLTVLNVEDEAIFVFHDDEEESFLAKHIAHLKSKEVPCE